MVVLVRSSINLVIHWLCIWIKRKLTCSFLKGQRVKTIRTCSHFINWSCLHLDYEWTVWLSQLSLCDRRSAKVKTTRSPTQLQQWTGAPSPSLIPSCAPDSTLVVPRSAVCEAPPPTMFRMVTGWPIREQHQAAGQKQNNAAHAVRNLSCKLQI